MIAKQKKQEEKKEKKERDKKKKKKEERKVATGHEESKPSWPFQGPSLNTHSTHLASASSDR